MKKLLSMILVCSMMFSMAVPAFASNVSSSAEAIQSAELIMQKTEEMILAGCTYRELLNMQVAEGIISSDEMELIIEHDSALLAQWNLNLDTPVVFSLASLYSDDTTYNTVEIPLSAIFHTATTASEALLYLGGVTALPLMLLTGAANLAFNAWKDNTGYTHISITYHVVRYYDDNSLSWRDQPFVDDYYLFKK